MLDNLNFSGTEIATWAAISISIVALYYSRKAIRLQVALKRNEQVASVNVFILQRNPELPSYMPHTPSLRIWNPKEVPLIEAKGVYYHRWLGAHDFTIDCRGIDEKYDRQFKDLRKAIDYLTKQKDGHGPEDKGSRGIRLLATVLFGSSWRTRGFPKQFGYRGARKRKRGVMAIAELFLTDGSHDQWYFNTHGVRLHIPRRGLRRWLFFFAHRARLIGYPFWSDFYWTTWGSIVVGLVDVTLIADTYFNDGVILNKVFAALGWL